MSNLSNALTPEDPVPGLDPVAARRWLSHARSDSPWLHEEVARRMVERLRWFREPPASWLHWEPMLGGRDAHRSLQEHLSKARCFVHDSQHDGSGLAHLGNGRPGWVRLPWRRSAGPDRADAATRVGMLWANMLLHQVALPQSLLRQWHSHVEVGGFLMFSCLGPDSLRELRSVYAQVGWPAPTHTFTDMHDWGDMLVHSGFAEPVMDMERLTLTYSSAQAMIDELRTLGRNLGVSRFQGLRGRRWRTGLLDAIESLGARGQDGRLVLTIELIYGHAFKSAPRTPRADSQSVSVDEMRAMLRGRRS